MNVALLVTLFWCVLAVASIILLVRARSKLMNDNIGKENNSDERNPLNQSTALRTSILRLIPMGVDIENTTRRGLLGADQDDRYAFQLPPVAQALLKIACEMDLFIMTIHLEQVAREDLDLVGKLRPGLLCANHSPFPSSWVV